MKLWVIIAVGLLSTGLSAAQAEAVVDKAICQEVARPDPGIPGTPKFLFIRGPITVDGERLELGNLTPGTKGRTGADIFSLLLKDCFHITQ